MSTSIRYRIQRDLPVGIGKQSWDYDLALQLRLWSLATDAEDFALKIILYFQIIEISFPDTNNPSQYPVYSDSTTAPDPRSECKFVRHLVAHAGNAEKKQLKKYCEFIGYPESMLDRTDIDFIDLLAGKVRLLEDQAKIVIQQKL